jgi:hypothetical protein
LARGQLELFQKPLKATESCCGPTVQLCDDAPQRIGWTCVEKWVESSLAVRRSESSIGAASGSDATTWRSASTAIRALATFAVRENWAETSFGALPERIHAVWNL